MKALLQKVQMGLKRSATHDAYPSVSRARLMLHNSRIANQTTLAADVDDIAWQGFLAWKRHFVRIFFMYLYTQYLAIQLVISFFQKFLVTKY